MTNKTIFRAYNETKERLAAAGIEDFGFEARVILRHVTGFDNKKILLNYNTELTAFQSARLRDIVTRRTARYPLQYILGEWQFYGRTFKVGDGVLIPRQDTETLVETALSLIKDKKAPRIADLCAGTGAIGITLALERADGEVTLVEKYDAPFEYLKKNANLLGAKNATLIKADALCGEIEGEYDLIVSNPPYVSIADMTALQPEVRFEPQEALCPGEDELLFYKAISRGAKTSLKGGGALCFEVGYNQADRVKEIMEADGFKALETVKDLSGTDRVVFGTGG